MEDYRKSFKKSQTVLTYLCQPCKIDCAAWLWLLILQKIEIQVLSQAFASFTICKGVGSISALGYEQKA